MWYGSESTPNVKTLSNEISTHAKKVCPANINWELQGLRVFLHKIQCGYANALISDETNTLDVIFVQDSEVSVVSYPKISFPFGKFHTFHES